MRVDNGYKILLGGRIAVQRLNLAFTKDSPLSRSAIATGCGSPFHVTLRC